LRVGRWWAENICGSGVGGQMLSNYAPVLTYTPAAAAAAAGHPSAVMSAAGTILLAAAPPGSVTPACTVLLVSNLNEEVRITTSTCYLVHVSRAGK